MAGKLGVPWLVKEDSATGRYFCKPLRVYKGTQSTVAVNQSGGHSTRRPSPLRIGSQWSVITSGRSNSDATTWGTKWSEVLMSFLEGVVPASNPRRLHLTCWTQSLSEVKVCLPLSPLWVELLHGEACSSRLLLLPASLEEMSMDSCPPRVASGSRLVHLLA